MRYVVVLCIAMLGVPLSGQASVAEPRFEVASVKPSAPNGDTRTFFDNPAAATFSLTNIDVRTMIARAYRVPGILERFVLIGGPSATLSKRFDVRATPGGQATADERTLMLRSLLAERFMLRTHTEVRPTPVYALVVARTGRLGPDLRTSTHDCAAWRRARSEAVRDGHPAPPEPMDGNGQGWCLSAYQFGLPGGLGLREAGAISVLAEKLQAFVDRPLIDATGLSGRYEWQVAFSPSANPPADSPLPSVQTAIREQLGLRLEPRNQPMEVRIIDHVEMPTPD